MLPGTECFLWYAFRVAAGWPRRRALEEHVLEVVRQPELGRRLVAPAHAQPELHRHDVARAVLLADDDDAVRQHLPRRAGDTRRARGHGGAAREEEDEKKEGARPRGRTDGRVHARGA